MSDVDLDAIENARGDALDDEALTYHERVSATTDLLGPDGYVVDLIAEVRRLRAEVAAHEAREDAAEYEERERLMMEGFEP